MQDLGDRVVDAASVWRNCLDFNNRHRDQQAGTDPRVQGIKADRQVHR